MNITHRIFIGNPALYLGVQKDLVLKSVFDKVEEFVKGRLMPLKDEIDEEEESAKPSNPCTIIEIYSGSLEYLSFNGYSENLLRKMYTSFSSEDFKFLSKSLEDITSAMDN